MTGQGFSSKQSASVTLTGLDDVSQTATVKVISATEASFVMPEGLGLGLKSVAVKVNGKELTESLRMVADSDANTLPIIIDDVSEVCSTKSYIDKNGDTQTGTKDCGGTAVAECSAGGQTGCKTTASLVSAEASLLTAANIKTGVTLGGVSGTFAGSYGNCSSDGEVGCITSSSYKAADMSIAIAGNIKSGITIAGVAGSATLAPANCSSASQQSCVATGTYYAGTACSAHGSACYLPAYSSGTQDKKAIDYSTIDASKMLDSLTVSGVTGTVVSRGVLNLTNSFPGAGYYSSASNTPSASTIASGTTINGVAGSATLAPANCSSNAAIGCVTTSTYKSADLTNLTEGNIKNGVTIAGVAGLYPNSTYTLPSASGTADLDAATFNAKVKSATAFEYWDSSGARQTGAGDADITAGNISSGVDIFGTTGTLSGGSAPNAWDVRAGTVVNGVTGKLKVNCRNTANSSVYNGTDTVGSLGTSGGTSGTTVDIWDTIEDYNNAGTSPLLPASTVSGWSAATNCGGIESTSGDDNVWKDVTTTAGGAASTCAADSARCTYQDKISGLWWSKLQSTAQAWNVAVQTCDGLNFNGQTDWRLPTQKELMAAYDHGIRSTQSANFVAEMYNIFWSASTRSVSTNAAWFGDLGGGTTYPNGKTSNFYVVCVR